MPPEAVILTAFSVLFAVIGFLIVDRLKKIDDSLAALNGELKDQRSEISNHDKRIAIIEKEHNKNYE